MIDTRAIEWLKKNFELEDGDLERFRFITNEQLKVATKKVGFKFYKICEYIEQQEIDPDKKAILRGFESHDHREKVVKNLKFRLKNLKIPPVERSI